MTDPRMTPTTDAPVTVERPISEHPCHGRFPLAGDRLTHRQWTRNGELMPTCERCGTPIDREHNETGPVSWVPEQRHRLAALASAPAGDVEMQRILRQLDEAQAWTANHEDGEDDPFQDQQQLLLDAAALIRSLARPRAAVGEREYFLAATIARSWMHHTATCQVIVHRPTGDGYKADCTCGLAGVLHEFDKHVLGMVTIPLQSPPAKVEG